MKSIKLFLVGMVVVMLTACGGGSNNATGVATTPTGVATTTDPPTNPASKIQLLSPELNSTVEYSYVTLEIKDSVSDIKAKIADSEYIGVKNGNSFFIYNVPLAEGENKIELVGDDGSENLTVTINSEDKGIPPIGLSPNMQEGFEKLDTTIIVQTSLSVSKYLFDKDNDGVTDEEKSNSSFDVSYIQEGRFFPMATVQTSDGIWYSTQKNISLDVKAKPTEVKIASITEQINDLERFGGYIYALSSTKVYKIDENNESKIDIINLSGVSNPLGFCYDNNENLYIADSSNNRVIRLLKSLNYQPDTFISQDGSFGTQGSGKGEFETPVDCMVDSTKDNEKIFVVDKGNNRIQVFNRAGVYINEFDGSSSTHGKLKNPEGILASSSIPIITDTGNNIIRLFSSNGNEFDFSVNGLFNMPKKITTGIGGYIVADSGNNRLVLISRDLKTVQLEVVLSGSPVVGVSFRNTNDNYYVSYNGNLLSNMLVNSDVKDTKPTDITKVFVEALLKKDRATMEALVLSSKVVDNIFEDIDEWVKFFKDNDIKSYNTYSKDSLISGVEILFNNTTNRFFVNLIKYNNTWYIKTF